MSRSFPISLLLIVLCLSTMTIVSAPSEADARNWQVKFFVTEYRLKMVVPEDPREPVPAMTLELRGKGSVHGGDKVEFRWVVPDATPYLPLLNACGPARLNGAVALGGSSEDRLIEGTGPLSELTCRMILK